MGDYCLEHGRNLVPFEMDCDCTGPLFRLGFHCERIAMDHHDLELGEVVDRFQRLCNNYEMKKSKGEILRPSLALAFRSLLVRSILIACGSCNPCCSDQSRHRLARR